MYLRFNYPVTLSCCQDGLPKETSQSTDGDDHSMNLLLELLRQESPVIQRLSCQQVDGNLPQLDMTSRQLRLMPMNQCEVVATLTDDESSPPLPEFQYDSKYWEARREAHLGGGGDFNCGMAMGNCLTFVRV